MKSIPELWELIELFESEPVYVYGKEEDIPWFYSTINFKLKRNTEALDITISPADSDVGIWIFSSDRKIAEINVENVEEMKIEKIKGKEILHLAFSEDDRIKRFFIVTKPQIFVYCSKTR